MELGLIISACSELKKNAVQPQFRQEKNPLLAHLGSEPLEKNNPQINLGPSVDEENRARSMQNLRSNN